MVYHVAFQIDDIYLSDELMTPATAEDIFYSYSVQTNNLSAKY